MAYKPKILALTEGGSNASLTASNGGIIYSTASAMAVLASTSTANQPLLSGASGAPGWSTATYPGSTTANRILYSSSNNVVGQITTANSGVLTTDGSGVPTITDTLSLVSSSTTMETLQSTDAGAGAGPVVDLYRNSASPIASDVIGQIQFNGQDTAPSKNLYGQITGQIDVATSGSENSRLTFSTQTGGALTTQLAMLNTGCQVRGNNTNTTPPAGFIGEVLMGSNTSGTALSSGVLANISSVTLTPGNWDISGQVQFVAGGTNTGNCLWEGILSATSASGTPIDTPGGAQSLGLVVLGGTGIQPITGVSGVMINIGPCRVSIAANTTYYLNSQQACTVTFNATGYGIIRAVRIG